MAGRCNASQDAQDAWDAGDASLASGRNTDGSDAGSVFADVEGRNINASVLNEDERNQEGIHNPREGRPNASEEVKR